MRKNSLKLGLIYLSFAIFLINIYIFFVGEKNITTTAVVASQKQYLISTDFVFRNVLDDYTQPPVIGDFTDVVRPDITYQYASLVNEKGIDKTNKTLTIQFDVTDKYFSGISLPDDTEFINSLTMKIDNVGGTFGDFWKNENVTMTLTKTTIQNIVSDSTKNNTIDEINNGVSKTIGYRYTLVVHGLDQRHVNSDGIYSDWSGTVTLAIPKDSFKDAVRPAETFKDSESVVENLQYGNLETTLTIGMDQIDQTQLYPKQPVNNTPGNNTVNTTNTVNNVIQQEPVIVDVVSPLFYKTSTSDVDIQAQTATMEFRVTDKYWKTNVNLKETDISVYTSVNNVETCVYQNRISN